MQAPSELLAEVVREVQDRVERQAEASAVGLRVGVVQASSGSTVSVAFGGGAAVPGIGRLASYSAPQVGDVVVVLSVGGSRLVLGQVA